MINRCPWCKSSISIFAGDKYSCRCCHKELVVRDGNPAFRIFAIIFAIPLSVFFPFLVGKIGFLKFFPILVLVSLLLLIIRQVTANYVLEKSETE